MNHPLLLSLAAALLPALGCDAQQPPDYAGEPIAAVRGSVVADGDVPDQATAAILWYTSDDSSCEGPVITECFMGYGGTEENLDFDCADACVADSCEPNALEAWTECVEACGVEVETHAESTFGGCATGGVGEAVALSVNEFPASFELALFEPPPAIAILGSDAEEPRVAIGALVALNDDAPSSFDFTSDDESVYETIVGAVESHALIYAVDPIPETSLWGQFLGGAYEPGYHLVRYELVVDCENEDECIYVGESRSPEPNGFDVDLELRFAPIRELGVPL